ncbi:MAG: hypothetical protein WGN25_07585 [Candidatus Electrothrix sp. GW3-4]|uniref:hypothetical protein n=1 Tax=Candidatus Electrothrix sp. GW3-4 TaxID=3126740 RepID=UPI0030CA9080
MKLKIFFLVCIVQAFVSMNAFSQESGEIVFAKKKINASSPTGLVKQFQAGDPIYSGAFLEKSILEMIGKETAKKVSVEVFIYELKAPLYDYQEPSEVQLETATLWVSGDALHAKYLPLDIVPGIDELSAYNSEGLAYKKFGPKFDGPVKFAEKLAELEAGEHTIIVKLNCNYTFVAEGRFVITGDDYTAYKKASEELNAFAANAKSKTAVMPQSARSDKTLEAEMVRAFKGSQTYKDRVKGEILRVVIIDPDWMTRRNELTGIILHRYIRAAIAVKNADGTCTVWQNVTFQQDYVSDTFQKTTFDGIGDPYPIPCENVKK